MQNAMNRAGQLVKCLALHAMLALAAEASAQSLCVPALVAEFGGATPGGNGGLRRPEVHLTDRGSRCLTQDLRQQKLIDPRTAAEMRTVGGDAIVLIGADDVSLDLNGHSIANERQLGYTLVKHYRYEPGRGHFHSFARTRISNGSLVSPGSRGIAIRLVSAGAYGRTSFGVPVQVPTGMEAADVYADTGHLIEDLAVHAGSRAILVDGRNNVIRNNRITVDGTTAIVAQGPGIVIENNLIEVRGDLRQLSDFDRRTEARTPFVIRLIQADGAIIRNNEIRLVDVVGEGPLPAAIELIASRDVLVEENRMLGMRTAVNADAASSHHEGNNRVEVCPAGETRFLPPPEAGNPVAARVPACRSGPGR